MENCEFSTPGPRFSLQNHLRAAVGDLGQIDEIFVGVHSGGRQFAIPVQAKGGTDCISRLQTGQDIRCCLKSFPDLVCRSISPQFMHTTSSRCSSPRWWTKR